MGISESFTRRYGLKRLAYAEHHEDIRSAIRREKP
jgi:putative endonuclease